MKIQSKITLVVIPILIVTLGFSGVWAYFSATSGITRLANNYLNYKVKDLRKAADSQWALLVDNNYTNNPEMVKAARTAVASYAISIMESVTEVIFAYDKDIEIKMKTNEITLQEQDKPLLKSFITEKKQGLIQAPIGGIDRVAMGFYFEPFGWYMLVTEQKTAFYSDVDKISFQTIGTLAASVVIAVILLFFIARILTQPLIRVVNTMKEIISFGNLSKRVPVEFQDETGQLAHTFNIMVGELEKTYNLLKKYAFEAVIAQKREAKIRNIFQKYVPQEVIDKLFENPESELIGDNRVLAILFSDIRDFTTISEKLPPDEVVGSLNRYFSVMVDIILDHKGIVDKYIGDAIMAFFGAPVKHGDDAVQSVYAGMEMTEKVLDFNAQQRKLGKPEFHIGVGINYGIVTVGNIGSEKKMDYTVIGDMVNYASRLEGLTKIFHQELLISESLHMKVENILLCREIGRVQVKGKSEGSKIYATKRAPSPAEREAWEIHNKAMPSYYKGEFKEAASLFEQVVKILPNDYPAKILRTRCLENMKHPPEHWDGVEKMEIK